MPKKTQDFLDKGERMTENKAQLQAITHNQGPMLVLAGPGSGKTHVITKRIEYLIENYKVRPEEILVITFTKFAANEMKERFYRNAPKQSLVTFGTFHAVFFGILRREYNIDGRNILLEDEKIKMLNRIIDSTDLEEVMTCEIEDEREFIDNIAKEISVVKSDGLEIEEYEAKECSKELFRIIYRAYEKAKKQEKKLDFDDMINQCYKLLFENEGIRKKWQEKYRYILIDEFQDINQMQFDTIKLLAAPENNIFVVGDDDQSIYRFRGARPEIMLNFGTVYPEMKKVVLEVNYRSTKSIVNISSKVIKNNKNRYEKNVITPNEEGDLIHVQEVLDPSEESDYILKRVQQLHQDNVEYNEMAVIFRTNLDAQMTAEKLLNYGIPFRMRESLPNTYEHFISKDIIAYMKMVLGNRDRNYFLQIMNRPKRYIARAAVAQGSVDFEALRVFYCDKDWMQDRIDQLELDIRTMKDVAPYAMVQVLRKRIGYDMFLKEHAQMRNMDLQDLLDIIEDLQERMKEFATIEAWVKHVEDFEENLKKKKSEKEIIEHAIDLHTMHGSKGLEYKYVFVIACHEGGTPNKKAVLPEEIEEERRMFYVAMTRAKKKLTISYPTKKHGKDVTPSRFVSEILADDK